MKNPFMYLAVFLCLVITPLPHLFGQCLTAPTASCNPGGPLVTNGEVLNAGTTKWYYGPVATYNMLTLKGGTLVVCGDLTIDKFYMDSGKIFIQPGARFVIGNGEGAGLPLRGNSYFYNYGTFEVLRNLSFENGWASPAKPNVLINAGTGSILKMNNQYFVINNANSWFVNKGKAYFHGLITDPQASARSVCLGKGSETKMTVLYNKVKNSYFAPEPFACVNVSEFSQLWDTLCNANPYINMCLGLTHRTDSTCMPWGCKPNWGMCNLFRGCVSCATIQVLPTGFISFYAEQHPDGNALYWRMENPSATGRFDVETSSDSRQFSTLHSFAANNPQPIAEYAWFDAVIRTGINYYRVKYVDTASKFTAYTAVIKAIQKPSSAVRVYPNPFHDRLLLSVPGELASVQVRIINAQGQLIGQQQARLPGNKWELKLPPSMAAGIYFISIAAGGKCWKQKIIKQ